jgi:hypothetical protein
MAVKFNAVMSAVSNDVLEQVRSSPHNLRWPTSTKRFPRNQTALDRKMAAMTQIGPDDIGRLVDRTSGIAIGDNCNLARRLLILEMASRTHRVAPDVG